MSDIRMEIGRRYLAATPRGIVNYYHCIFLYEWRLVMSDIGMEIGKR